MRLLLAVGMSAGADSIDDMDLPRHGISTSTPYRPVGPGFRRSSDFLQSGLPWRAADSARYGERLPGPLARVRRVGAGLVPRGRRP